MAKRRRHIVPKSGPVWTVSSVDATLNAMPRLNAYACGHGVHGDVKYNRSKAKRAWRKEMRP